MADGLTLMGIGWNGSGASTGDKMLLETGDHFLLETGDILLLE